MYTACLVTTSHKITSCDVSVGALQVCYAHILTTERAFVAVRP